MNIRLLALLSVLSLAACGGGVGSGSKPESLKFVVSTTDLTQQTSVNVFQCVIAQPLLIATFTNGDLGNFNDRATFTSSNPAVVRVSDGTLPVPGQSGLFYANGTLLAVGGKGQTAIITADFAGLKTTLNVTIDAYNSITLRHQQYVASDNSTKRDLTRMTTSTRQQLRAEAVDSNGKTRDITTAGVWSIDSPDTAVATIGQFTGIFAAVALPSGTTPPATVTKTARVAFPACDASVMTGGASSTTLNGTANITLDNNAQLQLVQEADYTAGRMVKGTAQLLRVLARFDDNGDTTFGDSEQDLTFSGVAFTIVNPADSTTSSVFVRNIFNALLVAVGAGAADISAKFGVDDTATTLDERLSTASAPLRMNSFEATLDSILITPDPVPMPAINPATVGELNTQQLKAVATFTPTNAADCASPCTQPYQHDAIWTVDNTAQLFVSNASSNAGLAVALKNPTANTDVTVTATSNQAVTQTNAAAAVPFDTAILPITPSP